MPLAARTWGAYEIAALWIGMAVCIPTYMLAAGLVAGGMSWWQAVVTIALGNAIVLVPMMLTGHAGTAYGIPFPVLARASFGLAGSHVVALLRAGVACGWFGIQAWIGGEALDTMFRTMVPGWPTLLGAGFGGHTTTAWVSFLLFWGLNVYIIYRGMDLLRAVENWAAPFVLVMTALLLWWAVDRADGLGPLLAQPGKLQTFGEFLPVFIPSLTAMIGWRSVGSMMVSLPGTRISTVGAASATTRIRSGAGNVAACSPRRSISRHRYVPLADGLPRELMAGDPNYDLFAEPDFTWNNITQRNRLPLIHAGIGVDGLKTGHTSESGYGLVASARSGDQRLILAINGLETARERENEGRKLLEWGFRAFRQITAFQEGDQRIVTVIERADVASYRAKAAGRNQVAVN